jgi:hypothetical protein
MHQQKYFLKLDKEAFIKNAFVQYLRYGTSPAITNSICETAWQNPKLEYPSKAAWQSPKLEYPSKASWQNPKPVPEYYIWRISEGGRVRPSHAANRGL